MINTKSFSKFIESDTLSLKYHEVTHNIDKQLDVEYALDVIFRYWRRAGFPHYTTHKHKMKSDLRSLNKFDETTLFKDNKIDQTMHGLSLAWSYHPHWVNVKCGTSKFTPLEYWNNDEKLKEIIKKTWKWQIKHGNGTFTTNRLRQNLKIYGGNQSVSNFRPTAAKYIYNKYGNNGTIWDMSMGWGGRLLGFYSSNCKKYIGTDPSTDTFSGIFKMILDISPLFPDKDVNPYKLGSEIFRPLKGEVDLCFTSPPYFDTEKYSDEPTQSYLKYPSEKEWIDGFLTKTIQNCQYGLKIGGYMILNIANTPKHKTIEDETIRIALENGFIHVETLYLILSSVSGKGQKLEPIFVFQSV